jgi:hypothetical protein
LGGLTRGTPKQPVFGQSSPSIAQPLSILLPISAEAMSDCSLLRRVSSDSGGSAKTGELRVLDTSVGGVDMREGGFELVPDVVKDVEDVGMATGC